MNIVFLDIDGVLNTVKSCVVAPSGKYVGVVDFRIEILGKAMQYADFDGIVLSSTWKALREDNEDYIYLRDSLEKHNVKIIGKTEGNISNNREDGILQYLEKHPEVDDFVIIDDNHYNFKDHNKLWERFLDTKGCGIESATFASETPSISAMIFLDGIKEADKNN